MKLGPHPYEVRDLVLKNFGELGAAVQSPLELDETILLDDGQYVARSYRIAGLLAMWLIGVGIVQFYDGAGNMLRTVNLFTEVEPQRMAA